jgi:hypothetical protein
MKSAGGAILLLLVPSCGEAARAQDAGPVGEGGQNELTVRVINDFYHVGGVDHVPAPRHPFEGPRARVRRQDGSLGEWHYGEPASPGVYRLQVPDGPLYLGVDEVYVVDPPGEVDFGHAVTGRHDVELAPRGTELVLDASGLLPFGELDGIAIRAPNVDAYETAVLDGLPLHATELSAFPLPWVAPGLASGQRGDELWLLQERQEFGNQCGLIHYPRALHLTGVEVAGGTQTAAAGQFGEITSERLDVEVAMDDFIAAAHTGAPDLIFGSAAIVRVPWFGRPDDSLDPTPDVCLRDEILVADLCPEDISVFSEAYENPFPAEWPERFELHVAAGQTFDLPRAPYQFAAAVRVRVVMPLVEAEAGRVLPVVGPPLGLAANADGAGGLQVSWSPPLVGKADGYVVSLLELRPGPVLFDDVEVARYHTVATSLAMLPGSIEAGQLYYVRVTALAGDEIDVLRAPHHLGHRYGMADAVTGAISR